MDDVKKKRVVLNPLKHDPVPEKSSGGQTSDITLTPSSASSLVNKSDFNRPCSPSYGSRGETQTPVNANSDKYATVSGSSTPEADRVPLLSEKIRKKKQGSYYYYYFIIIYLCTSSFVGSDITYCIHSKVWSTNEHILCD